MGTGMGKVGKMMWRKTKSMRKMKRMMMMKRRSKRRRQREKKKKREGGATVPTDHNFRGNRFILKVQITLM